jgi:hypothetical protein
MSKTKAKKPSANLPRTKKKEPRSEWTERDFEHFTVSWCFSMCDCEGRWGFNDALDGAFWNEILPKLREFGRKTWEEVKKEPKGAGKGTKSHPISIDAISKEAQDRLRALRYFDKYEELFSLRLDAKKRLYGIRELGVFRILWYDPNHEVYPISPK